MLTMMTSAIVCGNENGNRYQENKAQEWAEKIQKIPVGDINIAYRIYGDGYPLIMITGYSATMDLWDTELIDKLSANYKVIIFDNRGMGYTTALPGNFSMEEFADDTAGLMDALGIENAHILGWSMGTNIAQELALKYPEKVNKLVLYAADCGGDEAIQPSEQVLADMTNTSGTPEERGWRLFKLLFPEEWLANNQDIQNWFPDPTETTSPENIDRQTEAFANWGGTYDRLDQIKSPTLLITGDMDILTPPGNSLVMASEISHSWFVQIEGAGHGLMYQYPDKFVRIVEVFLKT
jgi:pimeloyl-ACP methyl ester carboxylesterase